ncbi:FHA domain-containing protein [Bacillus sp. 31A1R]|uniref:FHA domain-containing protein n=1 Tax=Robertmurraya mangrovi TaxID=3098077 RepID=A0ABU5J0X8_9BACI|nr:FHA domain-containing protein [Bacillus sp. 31A1R]MDZ5473049.1 FHA domain-containing protein [Bacillus sp. 31A1R]
MVQCANGHFYNSAGGSCPHCQGQGQGASPMQGRTMPITPPRVDSWQNGGGNHSPTPKVQPPNPSPAFDVTGGQPRHQPSDEGKTISFYNKQNGIDPVVGWLVCVDGKDKGQDYRIHSERNTIGRSDSNDIYVKGDQTISRDNHATIVFDPKRKEFRLLAGGGRGLVYVNSDVVDYTITLKEGDLIELGDTKLMFVPFCGPKFEW